MVTRAFSDEAPYELDQYGEDCIFIVRDPLCTRKHYKAWFSENERLLDATESNTILGSIIYQNWANTGPMLL